MSNSINLLPPDLKESYRYGRRNHTLARWITATVLCLVGGLVLAGGGYIYLSNVIHNTNQQISNVNSQLQSENQGKVQQQVTTISNNLKLATQVLSSEILFSKLLERLGAVTPSNAVLTNLAIADAQGGLDITAETTDYTAATQLQVNLADPANQIFSTADIESISCDTSGGNTSTQYPCSVTIRALFAKDNPFLFINDKSGGAS
ncbi:MAG TPA: hypothetical protein VMB52_01870 [Verrucomicrobiae bacterium]|nr:hypothetical protein [Verrucomicrobiae bacterium]